LAQRILSGLRTDTVLASSLPRVDIHVDNGAVVLQGNVQSELQRDTIAAAVRRAAGASPVRNELAVRPAR
jgi:osmotically-inducible protein OsmY